MNVAFQVNITDRLTLPMKNFIAALKNRAALHRTMGLHVREKTREHLRAISLSRKNKFGARSSRFWAKAADKVSAPAATDASAVITINHPGIRRAYEDITIKPGTQTPGVQWLTIPLIAAAYNRRAYRVKGLFRLLKKGATAIGYRLGKKQRRIPVFDSDDKMHVLSQRTGETLTHWYALVKSVLQKRDRTLLPSDEEFSDAALARARMYIRQKHAATLGGAA